MTSDGANNFAYDYRNMPIADTIKNGATVLRILKYAYDAAGQRIKMLRYAPNDTSLLDSSRIYVLNSNGKLMAEYVKNGSTWRLDHYNIYGNDLLGKLDSLQKRYYYLTDHLGSVRVTVKDTAGVPVDSWSDYYPFGKESRGSTTSNEPREQFTGKERDAETGLDYFGARYYNSEIVRFTTLDPLRHSYPYWTPYCYAGNNPIKYIDVDGKGPGDVVILFAGANVGGAYGPNKLGETPEIKAAIEATQKVEGTAIGTFESQYWGTDLSSNESLRAATDAAYDFIKSNYKEGGQVVIAGYSWGGNLVSPLADRLAVDGINVDLAVTIDQAGGDDDDNTDVNRTVSNNIKENLNIFQTTPQGGTGSHGGSNTAKDPSKTSVMNVQVSGQGVSHGNVHIKTMPIYVKKIAKTVDQENKKKNRDEDEK